LRELFDRPKQTYALNVSSLVGREAELGAVETFLLSESPRALAIAGEPGIGKTTLWQAAVELARAQGARVLVARPTESEARLGFAGLADLLADVSDELFSALPEPQRLGLEIALLRASSARPPERRVVGAGLLTLLRALAGESEVVCAIDDLQWLDASSAAVVEFALRRLGEEPVRGLFSVRATELGRAPIAALERDLQVELLELGPLSVAALHRVLTQELGRTFPRPTLVRIAQAAGGNPLYAIEIARELDRGGERDVPSRVPVPQSLDSLVRARVGALPADARDALLRAATLARPDTQAIDPADLAPAEEAGLVRVEADGAIEFVHPLFASAVYSAAPAARLREAHRAVADLARDPEERARHLALAAAGPDPEVVRELQVAARHARLRGSPDSAAELTGLALRLLPADAPARLELQLELAEQLHLASDFQAARALLEELRTTLPPGDLRARALLTLVEIDYWGSGESAATALAEEALADAREPVLKARCHAVIALFAGTVDLPKAAASARAALALLDDVPDPDPGLVAAALSARVRADLFLGEGFDEATAMRALALEESSPPATVDTRVVFKLGQWLRYVDDLVGASARLEQAEQQAHDEGDESSLANILLNRVIVATWAGDLTEAEELAERMVDAFGQQGVGAVAGDIWRAYVDAYAGRLEPVRDAAARAEPREPMGTALWGRCLGLAELAAGDTTSAYRHLAEALEIFETVAFREPAIWRVDGDTIEAAVAVGDVQRAEGLLSRFEERAARSRIPWSLAVSARCRGLVLAAAGELEAAEKALEHALVEHERCPMPFERARTLLVQGRLQRRLKQKRQARLALEEARELFARQGAETWVARVDEELGRVAVRRAPEELSATELRIAQLAAEGLTNKAIAEQVFVSVKTVESNLKRAYAKLEISSRAQLARALDRGDAQAIS
jgi:DNA-binding CsgD family transcriptional regulator/tetratricopeptide (TPR) repeat protein